MKLSDLKIGDSVIRMLAGKIPMPLTVTGITATTIICSWWEFSVKTGIEEDAELGWGDAFGQTGSFIVCPSCHLGFTACKCERDIPF